MERNDRLLAALNGLAAFVLAPLVMVSVVMGWSGFLQLTLTLAMVIAVSAPHSLLAGVRRRR